MSRTFKKRKIYNSLQQHDGAVSRAEGIHHLMVGKAKKDILNEEKLGKAQQSQAFLFNARAQRQQFIERQKRMRVF